MSRLWIIFLVIAVTYCLAIVFPVTLLVLWLLGDDLGSLLDRLLWLPLFIGIGVWVGVSGLVLGWVLPRTSFGVPAWLKDGGRTVAVLGLVITALMVLQWYVSPEAAEERVNVAQAGVAIFAGTAIFVGSLVAWQNFRVNQERLDVDREGQITERFTRAIDQLGRTDEEGRKQLEIRLGGIYALERVSRDSESDYSTVMEILAAYVRQHLGPSSSGQVPPAIIPISTGTAVGQDFQQLMRDFPRMADWRTLTQDIEVIIDVLGRRIWLEREILEDRKLNLRGVNLSGFELSRRKFIALDLTRSDLSRCFLYKARLSYSSLVGANLSNAILSETCLKHADLRGADFAYATFHDTDISYADLRGARNLTANQLRLAIGTDRAKLPTGIQMEMHLANLTTESR